MRRLSVFFGISVLLIVALFTIIISSNSDILAATYGWIQSSWAGGADTNAVANHNSNQTNWDKYYSKDTYVSATTDIRLSTTSQTLVDTTTSDFSSGTFTDATTTGNEVVPLLQGGATCSTATQCQSGVCTSNICGGP